MDQKTEKILQSLKGKKIGVFCDDSNLYYSYKNYGWRIDFEKLKNYVVKDKQKKIIFLSYEENMAWELRQCWHIYVNRIRDTVGFEFQK